MKKLLLIGGIIILPLILISCAAQPAIGVSEEAPLPTPLPQTNTPEPTATLALTPTPEGQIFRDDFTGQLRSEWSWENEVPSRWTLTYDGRLQIIGQDPSLLLGGVQSNLLWTTLPEGDFAISVHLQAQPVVNFQQATMYLYENPENFVALNRGYCGFCVSGGNAIYMEYKIGKDFGTYKQPTNVTDLYLKLVSQENVISGYYAFEPDQWQRLGRFGNYFQFKRVGLGVSNVDQKHTSSDDLIGMFDYFEITRP